MAELLPKLLVVAGGLCLAFVLIALWQSLRGVLAHAGRDARRSTAISAGRAALLREKDALLGSLRELRMEHELGKLGDADFQRLEQGYRARARDVLRALDDQLAPFRERAHALLTEARGGAADPAPAAEAKPAAPSALANTCAGCGARNDVDAVFCKKCGARLQPEGTA